MPARVGKGGLYRLLVLALYAFPLLLRCFAFHGCQSLWHMPSEIQESGPPPKITNYPTPEAPLQRLRIWIVNP